ncbi:MAG: ribosome recycling factor [Proteobacteria bacterium]|nr:ribosome recycling factor [Pseudomonadota bacterium]MCH8257799.1 ribosome recycling factor [Pseudomonadota bacterium]
MIEDIRQDADERMNKTLASLESAFIKIRTGRAHPGILDGITVEYYGNQTPLNQVANILVEDARSLLITPWEKAVIPLIEKAILKSDLGLNPATSGDNIRLPMPPLTEENRKDLAKVAKNEAENARIAIRNIRRDANSDLKEFLKEKEISQDDFHRGEELVQKLTDQKIRAVESALESKESDLLDF